MLTRRTGKGRKPKGGGGGRSLGHEPGSFVPGLKTPRPKSLMLELWADIIGTPVIFWASGAVRTERYP